MLYTDASGRPSNTSRPTAPTGDGPSETYRSVPSTFDVTPWIGGAVGSAVAVRNSNLGSFVSTTDVSLPLTGGPSLRVLFVGVRSGITYRISAFAVISGHWVGALAVNR